MTFFCEDAHLVLIFLAKTFSIFGVEPQCDGENEKALIAQLLSSEFYAVF